MSFHLTGTNGFDIEAENERFSVVGRVVVRSSNVKILSIFVSIVNSTIIKSYLTLQKFHVFPWETRPKNCTKKRAARAARLFFVI